MPKKNQQHVSAPTTVFQAQKLAGEMLARLINGETSVGEAKAVCGLINCMNAGLHLRQEQARLTGHGIDSDVISDVHYDPNAVPSSIPSIEQRPQRALKKAR